MLIPSFAHEVYVLTPREISYDQHQHSVNPFKALASSHNLRLFLLYLSITLAVLALALFLKSTKPFKKLGSFIDKATLIAPDVIRIAFGLSLILSAKNNSLFGPELPLDQFPLGTLLRISLAILGIALTLGIFNKLFAYLAIAIWLFAFANRGWYMLTYINYLGEAIAIVLLCRQTLSLDNLISKKWRIKPSKAKYEAYSMPVARILFGFSLLFTAINVKFATSALPLDVVNRYHLTHYFPFDPLFVVLGAGLIESLIALLYMFGLLQRFNTIFFLIFLTLSLGFFKESVWPHYLLIALGIGIFLHKPDIWAADKHLFKSKSSR